MKRLILVLAFTLMLSVQHGEAACTNSPNLGLQICDTGDPSWDVFTNANWAKVDFLFSSPLSRTGTTVTLGTVPAAQGGTGRATYSKGDLLFGLSGGGLGLQAIGADGTVLTADSSQTNGVKWMAATTKPPFRDDISLLANVTDTTKKARFSLSGLTTASTRVYTLQDRNGTLADLAANTFTDHQTLANQKELRLREASGSGTNYTGFKAPASLAGNLMYELPSVDGADGDVLTTHANGTTTWETASGGGGAGGFTAAGGTGSTNVSTSTANYFPAWGHAAPSASNCHDFATYLPAGYTGMELKCHLPDYTGTLLTSTQTYTVRLRNDGTNTEVGSSCIIDNLTGNYCSASDVVGTFSVGPGDVCLKVTPANSPTAAPISCAVTMLQ